MKASISLAAIATLSVGLARGGWATSIEAAPRPDLPLTEDARQSIDRVSGQVSRQTTDLTFDNQRDLRDALSGEAPGGRYRQAEGAGGRVSSPGLKFGPVPNVGPAQQTANAGLKGVMVQGILGSLAGALVGMGLLPLFGPFGVVLGALLGGAAGVATYKLAAGKDKKEK